MKVYRPWPHPRATLAGYRIDAPVGVWSQLLNDGIHAQARAPVGRTFKLWALGYCSVSFADDQVRVQRVSAPAETLATVTPTESYKEFLAPITTTRAEGICTVRLEVLIGSQATNETGAFMVFSIE